MSGAGDIKLTKDGNVLLHEMVRAPAVSQVMVLTQSIYEKSMYMWPVSFIPRLFRGRGEASLAPPGNTPSQVGMQSMQ